ncbi:RidA family protein [soil metagenome]
MTEGLAEQRAAQLGLAIPDYADPPYGVRYGQMKPFHRAGRILTISGMTPETRAGVKVAPGRVGLDVSVDEGYAAARAAAINVLGLIRYAVGSLDEVTAIVSTLCFVVTTIEFSDTNLVANGAGDLFLDVFGDVVGRATSASVGVMNLSGGNCFEICTTIETRSSFPPARP